MLYNKEKTNIYSDGYPKYTDFIFTNYINVLNYHMSPETMYICYASMKRLKWIIDFGRVIQRNAIQQQKKDNYVFLDIKLSKDL